MVRCCCRALNCIQSGCSAANLNQRDAITRVCLTTDHGNGKPLTPPSGFRLALGAVLVIWPVLGFVSLCIGCFHALDCSMGKDTWCVSLSPAMPRLPSWLWAADMYVLATFSLVAAAWKHATACGAKNNICHLVMMFDCSPICRLLCGALPAQDCLALQIKAYNVFITMMGTFDVHYISTHCTLVKRTLPLIMFR